MIGHSGKGGRGSMTALCLRSFGGSCKKSRTEVRARLLVIRRPSGSGTGADGAACLGAVLVEKSRANHSSMKELLPPGRGSAGVAQQCPVGK